VFIPPSVKVYLAAGAGRKSDHTRIHQSWHFMQGLKISSPYWFEETKDSCNDAAWVRLSRTWNLCDQVVLRGNFNLGFRKTHIRKNCPPDFFSNFGFHENQHPENHT
jgi:hypothetical protein